jgi:hypothetical protein
MTTVPSTADIRNEPAGRRLDNWVAQYVIGWTYNKERTAWMKNGELWCAKERFRWSSDWSDAGPLLESCPHECGIDKNTEESCVAIYVSPMITVSFDPTKPGDLCRAICVALLLAALATKGEQP